MLYIQQDKLDSLFELIAEKNALYIPQDNETSSSADFKRWEKGSVLSRHTNTLRSAKDFFFPETERLVNYRMNGKEIQVEDPRKDVEDFVLFGVKACDAKGISVIDRVYLNMDPVDTYYKNRREHGTIIVSACIEMDKECFCSAYGIDPSLKDESDVNADILSWNSEEKYYFKPVTQKGINLLNELSAILINSDDEKEIADIQEKIKDKEKSLPFGSIDVTAFTTKQMLDIFNSSNWEKVSEPCLGCGTCTYVCPTCMCFDVRDFDTGNGIQQKRCWDSCMYSDFTQMAAENPRNTQKERSRQRFMHKLVYYPMAHEGHFACTGCGRCVKSCPVNMNILKVIKMFNKGI